MAADRQLPDSTSGVVTGPNYLDQVRDEVVALWQYSQVPLTVTGGTANSVTASSAVPIVGYANGQKFTFTPSLDVTGALQIDIDGKGLRTVVDANGTGIVKGLMFANARYPLEYDASGTKLIAYTVSQGVIGRQRWSFNVGMGEVYARVSNPPAATQLETTTNKVNLKGLGFDGTAAEYGQLMFRAPKRWDEGTLTARLSWAHTTGGSGFGVTWKIRGTSYSDDDATDIAFGTAVAISDTGGTANDIYITAETGAITLANTPNEGDVVVMEVYREPTDASDTLTIDAVLLTVDIFWTANASIEPV